MTDQQKAGARQGTKARKARADAAVEQATATAAAGSSAAASGMETPWFDWMQAFSQGPANAVNNAPLPTLSPERMLEMQQEYVSRLGSLFSDFIDRPDKTTAPIKDNRFSDPAWQQNSMASFAARTYLLNAEFMNRLAESVEADRKTRDRLKFAVSQFMDAASPSNFLALNPRAQQRLVETKGESLRTGLENLFNDVAKGKISQSDESAFEIGHNVATSEGQVVCQNRLMQLIQYKPLTGKVHARPFVFVPPCINKYYILDLQPDNSMIRYAVEQGHTVFVVSWKNPQQSESKVTWDEYVEEGPITAIHVAHEISGAKQVNVLGFCVGGTIICTALAVMYARGEDPVSSLTLMTALLDFEDTGVLDIFVDEAHVRMREKMFGKGGLMPGRELANTFSSLRANDLVWNYVVSNYLEGKQPPAFDLLYWNGDSTNLPGPMYTWYMRNMYLENNLRVPNRLECCGEKLDLGTIRAPTYAFAAREDHIVPWRAAYASARTLTGVKPGQLRFVLGASGHIAGSINPPSKNKRSYWTSDAKTLPADSDAWFAAAQEHPGSWWSDWSRWLATHSGPMKAAPRSYGNAKYKPREPAPGSYVKEKA
jgi:polyhydroxyalkanoate synthase subunit PhaC